MSTCFASYHLSKTIYTLSILCIFRNNYNLQINKNGGFCHAKTDLHEDNSSLFLSFGFNSYSFNAFQNNLDELFMLMHFLDAGKVSPTTCFWQSL